MVKLHLDIATTASEFKHTFVPAKATPGNEEVEDIEVRYFMGRESLYEGRSEVFLGEMASEGNPTVRDVVCKFVQGDTAALKAEARLYDGALRTLQGKCIPKFYGYFEGEEPLDGQPTACLLLEYCGKPLYKLWEDHPMQLRVKAMDILLQIHSLGVVHNNWTTSSTLMDDNGNLKVIEFGDACLHDPDGVCPLPRNLKLFELTPNYTEIQCQEIYDVAIAMDLFTPYIVTYMGIRVDLSRLKSLTDLVNKAIERDTIRTDADLIREARYVLNKWREKYEDRIKYGVLKKRVPAGPTKDIGPRKLLICPKGFS